MDLSALRNVSYGLYIVGVNYEGKETGCVINTCMQLTSQNPLFAICLNKDNYTYQAIKQAGVFSLSILSEQTEPSVIGTFGFKSGRDTDKFAQVKRQQQDGTPILTENVCANLILKVEQIIDVETHCLITARLVNTVTGDSKNPMTYSYYHKVIKGSAPKSAPTYQENAVVENEDSVEYVCSVCGYVHKGELPDDFICPICKVPKENFRRK
ncbi:MAG: hypothetical protein E7480_04220 [Ruminococcaceae bacterium]|nr:hypothetical protein [Oscillospiraceae bacterium]